MFAYGICVGPSGKFERLAEPSIRAATADGLIWTRRGYGSIHEAYNSLLDEARTHELEGLVLMHDDVVIEDPHFEPRLREALRAADVGVVGVIGGRDHPEMPWWEGTPSGYVRDRQNGVLDFGARDAEVDTVDGLLLVLSPRAIATLRFDEQHFEGFHGYDADICAAARHEGMQVRVAPLGVFHANTPGAWLGDYRSFRVALLTWNLKWRPEADLRKRCLWRAERRRHRVTRFLRRVKRAHRAPRTGP